jgi:hypothetical protein
MFQSGDWVMRKAEWQNENGWDYGDKPMLVGKAVGRSIIFFGSELPWQSECFDRCDPPTLPADSFPDVAIPEQQRTGEAKPTGFVHRGPTTESFVVEYTAKPADEVEPPNGTNGRWVFDLPDAPKTNAPNFGDIDVASLRSGPWLVSDVNDGRVYSVTDGVATLFAESNRSVGFGLSFGADKDLRRQENDSDKPPMGPVERVLTKTIPGSSCSVAVMSGGRWYRDYIDAAIAAERADAKRDPFTVACELREAQQEIVSLAELLNTRGEQCDALESQLREASVERDNLKVAFREVIDHLDQVFQQGGLLPDFVHVGSSKSAAVVALAKDYLNVKAERDELRILASARGVAIESLSSYPHDYDLLKRTVDEQAAEIELLEVEVDNLQSRYSDLESENNQLRCEVETRGSEIEKLQIENKRLKIDWDDMRNIVRVYEEHPGHGSKVPRNAIAWLVGWLNCDHYLNDAEHRSVDLEQRIAEVDTWLKGGAA